MNERQAEQLYYTLSGTGLSGGMGWQIRAISPSLRQRLQDKMAIIQQLSYHLPSGMDPLTTQPEGAPRCLALMDLDGERWLVHKTFVQRAPDGRYGIHFTHIVALGHAGLTSREAIRTWRSPFWKTSDSNLPPTTELANVAFNRLEPGPLTRARLRTVVPRDDLAWVIHAYLSRREGQRLYLVGPSDVIAGLIYGLTLCLPTRLLQPLTFTTYEPDPLQGITDIVGTTLIKDDLPPVCYTGEAGYGLNCGIDGRRSTLPALPVVAEFARQAAERLIDDTGLHLDEMVRLAETKGVSNIDKYLALFRFFSGQRLNKGDIDLLLGDFGLAATVLARADVQNTVLDLTLDEVSWWRASGERKLRAMRASPPPAEFDAVLQALAKAGFARAQSLLVSDNPDAAVDLLDGLVALASGNEANTYWAKLLTDLPSPSSAWPRRTYTLRVRRLLLQRWAKLRSPASLAEVLPWLRTTWDEVAGHLALELPPDWQEAVLKQVILDSPTPMPRPADFSEVIHQHKEVVDRIIIECARDASTRGTAAVFFATLVDAGHFSKMPLLAKLLQTAPEDGTFQDTIGRIALPHRALTKTDATGLLRDVSLAEALLPRQDIQASILSYVLSDADWWRTAKSLFDKLRVAASQRPDGRLTQTLASLEGDALDQAERSLRAGDVTNATWLLDEFTQAVSGNSTNAWLALLPRLTPSADRLPRAAYTGAVRQRLVERWATAARNGSGPPVVQVKPWLTVSWSELRSFLPLISNAEWQREMISMVLRTAANHRPSGDDLRTLVTERSDLFHQTLAQMARAIQDRPTVLAWFTDLVSANYANRLVLLETLLASAPDAPTFQADLVKAVTSSHTLADAEYDTLLSRPTLAAAFLAETPVCQNLAERFGQAPDHRNKWAKYIQTLRETADKQRLDRLHRVLDNLTEAAWSEAQTAIRRGDASGAVECAIALVEQLARAAQPPGQTTWSLWTSVVEPLKRGVGQSSNRVYPLSTRLSLLGHWGTLPKNERPKLSHIQSWLEVGWKELGELLAFDKLPPKWHMCAIRHAILSQPNGIVDMGDLVKAHHEVFDAVLQELMTQGRHDAPLAFLGQLANQSYSRRSELAGTLLAKGPNTGEWTDKVLRAAQLDEPDLAQLLLSQRQFLLTQRPIASVIVPAINAYLDKLTLSDCQKGEVSEMLSLLKQATPDGIRADAVPQIQAWHTLADVLAARRMEVEPLQRLAEAISTLPEARRPAIITELFTMLSGMITRAEHVSAALSGLPLLVGDAATVWAGLTGAAWRFYVKTRDAWRIPPYVEYIADPQYAVQEWQGNLDRLLQNADQPILNAVSVAQATWTPDARSRWETYRRVHHATWRERVRERVVGVLKGLGLGRFGRGLLASLGLMVILGGLLYMQHDTVMGLLNRVSSGVVAPTLPGLVPPGPLTPEPVETTPAAAPQALPSSPVMPNVIATTIVTVAPATNPTLTSTRPPTATPPPTRTSRTRPAPLIPSAPTKYPATMTPEREILPTETPVPTALGTGEAALTEVMGKPPAEPLPATRPD